MLPKLIDLHGFFLPTYGVLVATAFLTAVWLTTRLATRAGLDPERVTNLAIYCALAGIIGAKLTMFLFDWSEYAHSPGRIFTWETVQAAGVYQGGLILALIVAAVFFRRTQLPPLRTADVFAPGVALGHAIGRIGCFAAGCCWGVECHLPWAVTFRNPQAHELVGTPLGVPLHPTQLYESLTEFAIFGYLYRRSYQPHVPGTIIGQYLLISSTGRFLIEFFRSHAQALPFNGPFSLTQWISLGLGLVGAALLVQTRRTQLPAVSLG